MSAKTQSALARFGAVRDPFAMLRQITSELDGIFEESAFPSFRSSFFRTGPPSTAVTWFPEIDVFARDNELVTKIDLPGMKKEDVKVEVADGQLVISGERKTDKEEQKDNIYRCEREYGSFYRAVPLPAGVKIDDVKATFADGVLEVRVPMPAQADAKKRTVEIGEPSTAAKPAA